MKKRTDVKDRHPGIRVPKAKNKKKEIKIERTVKIRNIN